MEINSYNENDFQGHFNLLEHDSQKEYTATLEKLVLFLTRLCAFPSAEHDNSEEVAEDEWLLLSHHIHQHASMLLSPQATVNDLHLLLVAVFAVFHVAPERDDHITANFVKFSVNKREGGFIALSTLIHQLVHIIHMVRLVAFEELGALHDDQDREEVLQIIRIRFVFASSAPTLTDI